MSPYPGVRRIIDTGADQSGTQLRADASARKSQSILKARERIESVEKTIQNSDLAGDDGVAPLAPVNVQITPYFHELILSWDDPPPTDFVSFSIIRATPEGEAPVEARGDPGAGFIKDLSNKPHSVIVKLIDRFGRESPWSNPLTGTPLLTAAETIDLGELAMLNRIRGLLPNANLQTITDATKLGAGIVGTETLGPGAVTGPKVASSAIAQTHIGADQVGTPQLIAGSVKANQIDAGAVTTPKIFAGAVTANEMQSDSVLTRHLRAGAVTADVMATQDAAAFNLWAQNAMIRSAAIASLTADKITAGTMTAGQILLAGSGSVKAGQTELSSSGLSIAALSNYSFSSASNEYKISSTSRLQSLYFTNNPLGNGAILQGDADSAGRRGYAILGGINNASDFDAWGNATVRSLGYIDASNTSQVNLRAIQVISTARDTVQFQTPLTLWTDVGGPVTGSAGAYRTQVYLNTVTIAAGVQVEQPHPFGNVPAHVDALYDTPGGWRPFVNNTNGLELVSGTGSVVIYNQSSTARTVRAHINQGTFG